MSLQPLHVNPEIQRPPARPPLQDDTAPGPPLPKPDSTYGQANNGDLFFGAQYFHMSGEYYQDEYGPKEETLADEGPSHLYRIRPDGSRQRQLTWGRNDDYNPHLSPDGKYLLFVRFSPGRHVSICSVGVYGGPVTTLLKLPGLAYDVKPRWSPDGRWIALIADNEEDVPKGLILLHSSHRTVRRFPNVQEFAWSPDSRLYMCDEHDSARILDPASSVSVPVKNVLHAPLWLDAHTLVGEVPNPERPPSSGILGVINDRGIAQRQVMLRLIGEQNDYATFYDEHAFYRLPRHRTTLIMETWRWMSDGDHYGCYRVDLRTGKCRLIQNGMLIGIAPDGSQIAVANHEWVGPDKRGGERVGPLQLVTLQSGRTRSISSPLTSLAGGEWSLLAFQTPRSLKAALLQAVEQGDVAQVHRLLARGAPADAEYADGCTALMLAAGDGNQEIVRLLLRYHAAVNATDRTGRTALMLAVGADKAADEVPSSTQQAVILCLLHAGAWIEARDAKGQTALMQATLNGRATVVVRLLGRGAKVNSQDDQKWTAVMLAASKHYPYTVRALLKARASIRLMNKDKETALSIAQEVGGGDDEDKEQATEDLLKQALHKE
jgi:hypothetical protein